MVFNSRGSGDSGSRQSCSSVPEINMSRSAAIIVLLSVLLAASHVLVELAAAQAEADSQYITDVLIINIRDKPEKPNVVVGVVRTGDAVRIVEEKDTYVKIETADNKQGWISKQYLKKEMPESVNAQQLRQEVADLKKQLEMKPTDATIGTDTAKDSGEVCAALQQKLNDAEKQLQQLQEQLRKQSSTPGSSADAPGSQEQNPEIAAQLEQTSQRYNQLIIEYEKRGEEIAELQNSMAKHDDTTRFLWFGAGAVVFFLGILAGRSANKKKNKFLY